MRSSYQVLEFPSDSAIEKFSSWVRIRLSDINTDLPQDTCAEVRLQLPRHAVHRITLGGLDDLMRKEIKRHARIRRIVVEEVDEA